MVHIDLVALVLPLAHVLLVPIVLVTFVLLLALVLLTDVLLARRAGNTRAAARTRTAHRPLALVVLTDVHLGPLLLVTPAW
eukprot:7954994-Pyramimonas_sp.AAC.1